MIPPLHDANPSINSPRATFKRINLKPQLYTLPNRKITHWSYQTAMAAFENHEEILEAAFKDPNNTAIVFEPCNVNKVIHSGHYDAEPDLHYTKTQLWDMEVKKAHDPAKYLRAVVRPGSLKVFNVHKDGPKETFVRVTDQRTWRDPTVYNTVIEQVFLDHDKQKAFFIGVPEVEGPDGRIVAGKKQALFHVEHSATGTEDEPLNVWRVVHLDKDEDGSLRETFKRFMDSPYLREFNEIYIREDLGKKLERI
ncbi:hypothetical protein J3F83DRAFT_733674 [Trichoderma novae-zelandiae]